MGLDYQTWSDFPLLATTPSVPMLTLMEKCKNYAGRSIQGDDDDAESTWCQLAVATQTGIAAEPCIVKMVQIGMLPESESPG